MNTGFLIIISDVDLIPEVGKVPRVATYSSIFYKSLKFCNLYLLTLYEKKVSS